MSGHVMCWNCDEAIKPGVFGACCSTCDDALTAEKEAELARLRSALAASEEARKAAEQRAVEATTFRIAEQRAHAEALAAALKAKEEAERQVAESAAREARIYAASGGHESIHLKRIEEINAANARAGKAERERDEARAERDAIEQDRDLKVRLLVQANQRGDEAERDRAAKHQALQQERARAERLREDLRRLGAEWRAYRGNDGWTYTAEGSAREDAHERCADELDAALASPGDPSQSGEPVAPVRCAVMLDGGRRCPNTAHPGSDLCWGHGGDSIPSPEKIPWPTPRRSSRW